VPRRREIASDSAFAVLGLALALAFNSCGWLREATAVTVCAGEQPFGLDAGALSVVDVTAGGRIPTIPCSVVAECRQALVSCTGPRYSCAVDCQQADAVTSGPVPEDQQCPVSVTFDYEEVVEIDLAQQLADQSQAGLLSRGRLTRLVVGVAHNSLELPTPALDIYVGALAAESGQDSGVVRLATIESVAAEEVFEARETTTTEAGRERLAELIGDGDEPFRLFVRGQIQLQSGDLIPTGRLITTVEPCFRFELL
jgi:hypothetical protein